MSVSASISLCHFVHVYVSACVIVWHDDHVFSGASLCLKAPDLCKLDLSCRSPGRAEVCEGKAFIFGLLWGELAVPIWWAQHESPEGFGRSQCPSAFP